MTAAQWRLLDALCAADRGLIIPLDDYPRARIASALDRHGYAEVQGFEAGRMFVRVTNHGRVLRETVRRPREVSP